MLRYLLRKIEVRKKIVNPHTVPIGHDITLEAKFIFEKFVHDTAILACIRAVDLVIAVS